MKLFVCDVDGVFLDGCIYFGNVGEEFKVFYICDGYGVKVLVKVGIFVVVIIGCCFVIVENRMKVLNVDFII